MPLKCSHFLEMAFYPQCLDTLWHIKYNLSVSVNYTICIMHLLRPLSLRVHAFSVGDPTGWSLRMERSPGTADSEMSYILSLLTLIYLKTCLNLIV